MIGELNGPWAAWFKVQIALVPMLAMAILGGGIYQIAHNTKVDTFMDKREFYTPKNAIEDHVTLRYEFEQRFVNMELSVDALRLTMQRATPEADRRLSLMEQTLASIQTDIVSMRITLAQIRLGVAPWLPVPMELK
jgi:hypothetical protein